MISKNKRTATRKERPATAPEARENSHRLLAALAAALNRPVGDFHDVQPNEVAPRRR